MSDVIEPFHVLREVFEDGGGAQIIAYGKSKPELAQVIADLVKLVESPVAKKP